MKKIFTLALVAALALAANAGMPQKKELTLKEFGYQKVELPRTLQHTTDLLSRADDEEEAEESASYWKDGENDVTLWSYNFYYLANTAKDGACWIAHNTTVNIDETAGTVKIDDFFNGWPLEGTLTEVEGKTVVSIPLGTVLAESAENGFKLVLGGYDPELSDDIVYEGNFTMYIYNNALIGRDMGLYIMAIDLKDDTKVLGTYDGFGALYAWEPNATYNYDIDNSNMTDEEGLVKGSSRMYVDVYALDDDEIDEADEDPVVVEVMASFLMPFAEDGAVVEMSICKSGYVTCEDQIAYAYYSSEVKDFLKFYVCTMENDMPIATSLEPEFENGRFTWGDWCIATGISNPRWFGPSSFGEIVLDNATPGEDNPDEPGDAINTISADNSNAPVEYFNLQGVRVANPAAGSIVIRRQGNEASKFFVK